MRCNADQLLPALQRLLAPLYLVSGDELLLVTEACQQIAQVAQQAGYIEHQVITVDNTFDWEQLHQLTHHLSLFSAKQFIELRLSTGKLTSAAAKIVEAYIGNLPVDVILVLRMAKMDATTQSSSWLKAWDKHGVIVRVWPITLAQMPRWIGERLRKAGLETSPDAIQLLAERNIGNLSAAEQDIEKLRLRFGSGKIDLKNIAATIFDNASFDVFQWVDSVVQKQPRLIVRILGTLRATGVEPPLILWALARECRKSSHTQLLQRAHQIDLIIKGVKPGNVWDELLQLGLMMAGRTVC